MKFKVGNKVVTKRELSSFDGHCVPKGTICFIKEVCEKFYRMTVPSGETWCVQDKDVELVTEHQILMIGENGNVKTANSDTKVLRAKDGTLIGEFGTGGVVGSNIIHNLVDFSIDINSTKPDAERLSEMIVEVLKRRDSKKEEKKVVFRFWTQKGTRIDKTCNSTVPTITTAVTIDKYGDNNPGYHFYGEATCDATDYSERQGCLEAIANAVLGGSFDKMYNKAVKVNEFCERQDRTCHYCGQLFDTIEERNTHEAWHVECRKARHERYLLRKRAKEIAFEEQAQKMAKEMMGEQK